MKKLLWVVAALAACSWGATKVLAEDLEILDPQIAQTIAQVLVEAAEKLEKPQVKIEGDVEKTCAVHKDRYGILLVPDKNVKPDPDNEGLKSDPGAPLCHLFMSDGFTLVLEGKPVEEAKLRTLKVAGPDGNEFKVRYLALTARHTDDDVWHIYGYGAEEKPLLDALIGAGAGPGTEPLAIEIKEFEDDAGTAYVTIFDQFQCSFRVVYKAPAE